MNSGGLRRGLHIDDDDVPQKYQYGGIEADRKKGKTQQSLDDMLFGKAPVRRRVPSENKPVETVKPADTAKPSEPAKVVEQKGQSSVNNSTSLPQGKTVSPPSNTKAPEYPAKVEPGKPNIKITESAIINPNKSTDSSKNVNQNTGNNTITITSNAKVVANQSNKPAITNAKNEPSILVPSNEAEKYSAVVNNIPIQSQQVLPAKNNANPQRPQVNSLPVQPTKVDEPITIDVLHPFSVKNAFNKPSTLRKLKKQAEDFKFAEENVVLHTAIDVVRPFETDRSRQKKLNDYDFKDYEFPSSSISLGGQHKSKASVWKKQSELAKTVSFGKYIDPNDINLGTLSNPHFVSTLSALSESEANIKRLIEDQKSNSNGFYLIRLFVNSVWRYITVQGSLPYIDNENAGIVSNPDSQFELSSALIEKAYAKTFGGYHSFSHVQPRQHYLRDLTGAPVKKYSIENPDVSNIVKKALADGQVVLAVPNQKIASLGLNPNFSYPVLGLAAKGSLELRNSFGTLEQKTKLSIRAEGNFDLGAAQVRDFISHILITNLNTAYATTTIQSRHRHGFYSSYNFKIRKDAHGFLTVSQWDQRAFPSNSGYSYSPFHVVLHKVEEDGESTYISAAFTAGSRNLDLQVNLSPGVYTVFVSANWKHSEYAYNLTFYGSERIDFQRVYNEKVPNLIGQSLESINLQEGKRIDLNKNSAQYFLYHHDSNLIVLTVENTSQNDATVTADLSKVKLDHLILLTSHNNEDNYSNKVGLEIDQYKQIPLTDRKWSVFLPGQHRFTWILATDQPYDESNPKTWGFN